jgi:hypothetical protein
VIGDFEARLAEVLGGLLPAPFRGHVEVEPGAGAGGGAAPRVLVGVRGAAVLGAQFGSGRTPRVVPGAAEPRRVVAARVTVRLRVEPASGAGRAQQLAGLDQALYALDAAELRDGSALATDGDPGFLIHELKVSQALEPIDAAQVDSPPMLLVEAEGLFWPRGVTGQAGVAIREIDPRTVLLPLALEPAQPRLTAGGPAIDLTVRVALPSGSALPFGALVVALARPGGRPGAGTLAGGTDGTGGARVLTVSAGQARVRYTPPAQPGTDLLVIALDDGARGAGLELGRFKLEARA